MSCLEFFWVNCSDCSGFNMIFELKKQSYCIVVLFRSGVVEFLVFVCFLEIPQC